MIRVGEWKNAFAFIQVVIMFVCFAMMSTVSAAAVPIQDQQFTFKIAEDGEIGGYFAGSTAGYDSYITAVIGGVERVPSIFNHGLNIGDYVSFGTAFAGESVVFKITVADTGDVFYSDKSLNLDGLNHFLAIPVDFSSPYFPVSGVWIGAEDLFGGGDLDFNDNTFIATNTLVSAVPEPSVAIMLLLGLGGLYVYTRKSKKQIEPGSVSIFA